MSYSIEQRDQQLAGTSADIIYEISFDRAPQHLVRVTMRIANITTPEVVAIMPSWSPGSYKIRDYAGWQGNVRAYVGSGSTRTAAKMSWRDKAAVIVETGGAATVEIDYLIYAHERTVRTSHVNRFHAFLMLTSICMYVEGRTHEIHHVLLKHDQSQWPHVSTALSPVQAPSSDGVLLGALNYDILADSPIEIGDHHIRTFTEAGAVHEVAVATNYDVDVDWLTEQIKQIVNIETSIFTGAPYDRYVFIIQAYPGAGGGLEHARSSVNAIDPTALLDKTKAIGVLSLLCHEYFHLWNVKRIRPAELGPFDYTRENYTGMLWLAEGLTSYYDDLLTFRCGFTTEKEYIEALSKEHVGRLFTTPGRTAMSTRDSSYLAWLKLYMQSPDGNNRFPSYYLKGGVIFFLLDAYIIDHSDGKYSMDDALRAMWKRYQANPDKGLTDEEVFSLIEQATKVQIRERLKLWLEGTDELPYDEILAGVGLALEYNEKPTDAVTFGEKRPFASVPKAPYIGWSLAESNGKIVVRGIDDDSPAARAGFGIDDEIVAIDDKRVLNVAHVEHLLSARTVKGARVSGHCDGRLFTTTLMPIFRVVPKLVELEKPTARQQQMRQRWLRRNS